MTIDERINQIEEETAGEGNTRFRLAALLREIYAVAQGTGGITPHIGDNGNWFIGAADTGIKAEGKDGTNGTTPHIGLNGNWFIGATDTGIKAEGKDGTNGTTPHIGGNGNWFIGVTDTKIKAEGKDGKDFEFIVVEDLASSTKTLTPEGGVYYKFGKLTNLTLQNVPNSVKPIIIRFSSGATLTTIVTPSNIRKQKLFAEAAKLTDTLFEILIIERKISITPFEPWGQLEEDHNHS